MTPPYFKYPPPKPPTHNHRDIKREREREREGERGRERERTGFHQDFAHRWKPHLCLWPAHVSFHCTYAPAHMRETLGTQIAKRTKTDGGRKEGMGDFRQDNSGLYPRLFLTRA